MNSLLKLILLFLSLTFISTTTNSLPTSSPLPSPPSQPNSEPQTTTSTTSLHISPSPFSTLTPILTSLGYTSLALASQSLSISSEPTPPFLGPITVFAPSETSLRTCSSCSLPLLLQEHSIPGLYSSDYLRRLPFGSKLETLLPGRCLTLTSYVHSSRIFLSNAEITFPDVFTSAHVVIHGVQGFLSHLSPYSCAVNDKMTSFIQPHASHFHHPHATSSSHNDEFLRRMMIGDVMIRLRNSGYTILALAMRVKYAELVTLQNMTIFAVDDVAIFHGGYSYVHSVRFHILPNILLHYADLERFPLGTVFPTLENGESLTVTSNGVNGVLTPVRINYVRVKFPDMLYNMKIVVHGLSSPFPRLSHGVANAVAATRQVSFASSSSTDVSSSGGETVSQHHSEGASSSSAAFQSNNHNHNDYDNVDGDYVDEGHHGL